MKATTNSDRQLRKLGGVAGLLAGLFLPGVVLQLPVTGWFPEEALANGEMQLWLERLGTNLALALTGVGCSIVAICCFLPFGFTLYKVLPETGWRRLAGLAAYVMGTALALASFTFAFGFSWGLSDVLSSGGGTPADLTALATMGMQAYVFSDDIATMLVGIGHLLFAGHALSTGSLPRWLCWWGIIAGGLVIMVLLRYFAPVFSFAQIGYPLVILWFVLTGIQLLRNSGPTASPST